MPDDKKLEILEQLVQKFLENRTEYIKSDSIYNETELRNDYLNPFLELLDWDVNNSKGFPQHLREVIHEDTVEIRDEETEIIRKKPDYAFRAGTERKFFLEAKKPSVRIDTDNKPAFQTRRYGWNAGFSISVLSNFDKLIIYDCLPRPKVEDDVRIARLKIFKCENYVRDFKEIYELLSRESIYSGKFDELFPKDIDRVGTEPFDKYFLDQISNWRLKLSQDTYSQNPDISIEHLNYFVQITINRIIFLRICEDRDLEKYKSLQSINSYEELKRLFLSADKKYDSDLFNFIDDKLSLNIKIHDEILVNIFKELYYPDSPYAFSVMESNVLGDVYELFLAQEVNIENNSVVVSDKPEIVASGGVVTTPKYIVDDIVNRTLPTAIQNKSPKELEEFTIADIACGSGTFLLSAYEYLINYYREFYLKDGPEKHLDKIYETSKNQWFLTLNEKQRILSTHIFGVDIDHQAIEVARFSLFLKTIENENQETIDYHLNKYKLQALPKLDENLNWGNSLVDRSFYEFNPDELGSEEVSNKIKPLDWDESFPKVFIKGGFNVIIGNPPYVRIQNMVHYSPMEVKYYGSQFSPYSCTKSDNFDKYSIFIERGLSLLKRDGVLGYIVPNKFLTIKSGKSLRLLLSSRKALSELVHFGVGQVFGNRCSTYTCILVLCNCEISNFKVQHVTNLKSWRYNGLSVDRLYEARDIDDKPWVFVSPQAESLFNRIENENNTRLQDVAEVFVGVQTSRDSVYVIKSTNELDNEIEFIDNLGNHWTIEKSILKKCIYDVPLEPYSFVRSNSYIIFPYRIEDNLAQLISSTEMREHYPKCWDYLSHQKQDLLKRNIQNFSNDTWYQFGRSQSLTKFSQEEKLIWPTLSLEPRYAVDLNNTVFTGGGNGPYYGLRMQPNSDLSIYYLLALLSHPVIDAYINARASGFRGGYKSHGKQFIQNVPIRRIDFSKAKDVDLYNSIIQNVQKMLSIGKNIEDSSIPTEKQSFERSRLIVRKKIEESLEALYNISDQEIKNIPEIADSSERQS